MEILLSELAKELGGEVVGDGSRTIRGVAPLETADSSQISFFSNRKYKAEFLGTSAGAVIVAGGDAEGEKPASASLLVVRDAYLAFAKASTLFHRQPTYPAGVDPRAAVEADAEIDPSATVMPFAYVGRGVKIGARTVIHAHCAILDGVTVGEDCLLYPGVVVREGCSLGARTIVQPGAVIGGDGFGFAFEPARMRHFKVPQSGTVQVGVDVEIGANTCVDRGTLGDTVIGAGTKIDNLVQLAHNVEIGPLSLLAGATAIAGSTRLGKGVVIGGQVGVIGHLELGDGARVAAASAVFTDIPAGAAYGGVPAIDQKRWLREQAATHQLPELLKELRALRKKVEQLEKER
ncbi:UDP-3-O-(3-hydroxymyristoyl)glucosamine N-acyltransferase [Vulgatibacter incomptus]|uniref:UDP-3-O-acylglucosamine N-acyltransferase n=1 Tax=Vulgatibacter incomptus TaxID=1391653 RepID=A0A0K1PDD8_9BACT|nr:UDP-3-O-(3-hydroxymyristoyl)glucosamine N-acyltransferase [Vulgatibacter incomptus]AKU91517.1 UDP-3-O-[3-hydroxymyristoyl] glucosamine N-acyltransferase [Vulgatibacter incomptus]